MYVFYLIQTLVFFFFNKEHFCKKLYLIIISFMKDFDIIPLKKTDFLNHVYINLYVYSILAREMRFWDLGAKQQKWSILRSMMNPCDKTYFSTLVTEKFGNIRIPTSLDESVSKILAGDFPHASDFLFVV